MRLLETLFVTLPTEIFITTGVPVIIEQLESHNYGIFLRGFDLEVVAVIVDFWLEINLHYGLWTAYDSPNRTLNTPSIIDDLHACLECLPPSLLIVEGMFQVLSISHNSRTQQPTLVDRVRGPTSTRTVVALQCLMALHGYSPSESEVRHMHMHVKGILLWRCLRRPSIRFSLILGLEGRTLID